jgi:hypothetical protein
MTMPLAADLLLLAYADDTGKPLLDSTRLNAALAGATVLELTVLGVLDIADARGPVRSGRLYRVPGRVAPDPLLEEVADVCHNKKPQDAISNIAGVTSFKDRAGRIKDALLHRLAAEGVLREERGKVLGLFPASRWPTADPSYERALVDRIGAVLVGGAQPDPRTAALISLLSAVDLAPKVLPGADKRLVRARAKEIAQGSWAAAGVRRAIESVTAAVTAAIAVPTIASQ